MFTMDDDYRKMRALMLITLDVSRNAAIVKKHICNHHLNEYDRIKFNNHICDYCDLVIPEDEYEIYTCNGDAYVSPHVNILCKNCNHSINKDISCGCHSQDIIICAS